MTYRQVSEYKLPAKFPTIAQWVAIYENIDSVNKALLEAGGQSLKEDYYWSSTYNGDDSYYIVNMFDGDVNGNWYNGDYDYYVRPVLDNSAYERIIVGIEQMKKKINKVYKISSSINDCIFDFSYLLIGTNNIEEAINGYIEQLKVYLNECDADKILKNDKIRIWKE